MTIPMQKKERVWVDPDQKPAQSFKSYFQSFKSYFSTKYFFLYLFFQLFGVSLMRGGTPTVTDIIIAAIFAFLLSPLYGWALDEILENKK